jgi:hypothetical protein
MPQASTLGDGTREVAATSCYAHTVVVLLHPSLRTGMVVVGRCARSRRRGCWSSTLQLDEQKGIKQA